MPAFMAATEYVPKNQKIMEKERKITAPDGCEIEKVEIVDGVAVVTFREKRKPKSWEEFCEMFPVKEGESYIDAISAIIERDDNGNRLSDCDKSCLPNRATAEAVLALCQLIQLRNCYNGDWAPDWTDSDFKFTIEFRGGEIYGDACRYTSSSPLYFKTEELCNEFLRNFRPLIEKLKPLYGIKEGGAE